MVLLFDLIRSDLAGSLVVWIEVELRLGECVSHAD